MPTRVPVVDINEIVKQPRHEATQSQQQSVETQLEPPLTPSTTEESMETHTTGRISSTEPLLTVPPPGVQKLDANGQQSRVPNLPGITPLRGHLHQQGWL